MEPTTEQDIDLERTHSTVRDIEDVVADAADGDTDSYAEAMDYFLSDETDIIKNPPLDRAEVERLVDGEHKIIFTCQVRAIDDDELRTIRQRSKERGPRGTRSRDSETDDMRFYNLLCEEAIVQPNLNEMVRTHPKLQQYRTVENLLKHKLLPGERVALGDHVLAFSGFGDSVRSAINKDTTAAKN